MGRAGRRRKLHRMRLRGDGAVARIPGRHRPCLRIHMPVHNKRANRAHCPRRQSRLALWLRACAVRMVLAHAQPVPQIDTTCTCGRLQPECLSLADALASWLVSRCASCRLACLVLWWQDPNIVASTYKPRALRATLPTRRVRWCTSCVVGLLRSKCSFVSQAVRQAVARSTVVPLACSLTSATISSQYSSNEVLLTT